MVEQLVCDVCGVEYEEGMRRWYHYNFDEYGMPTISIAVDTCTQCSNGYMDGDARITDAMDYALGNRIDMVNA